MSAFWHWYVAALTLVFIVVMVWLFISTGKAQVPTGENEQGEKTTGHVWDGDLAELNNPMPRWWLWLFYISVIFALAYLVLYPGLGRYGGMLGWSSAEQYEEEMVVANETFEARFAALASEPLEVLANNEEAIRVGRNLFAHNCSTCHGSDARGASGYPNLTDDHWIWGSSTDQIWHSIYLGRQAAMPGFGAALSDQDVTRVATYVQQLAGLSVDQPMAAAGKKQYDMICSACHGPQGLGNPMLGAPNLTAGIYTYGGSLDDLRYTIREGRNGVMPAQKDLLGEIRTRFVAAYILSMQQETNVDEALARE